MIAPLITPSAAEDPTWKLAESRVLGLALRFPRLKQIAPIVAAGITPAHFSDSRNRVVYECMITMHETGEEPDVESVMLNLGADLLAKIGGIGFLFQLENASPATSIDLKKEFEILHHAHAHRVAENLLASARDALKAGDLAKVAALGERLKSAGETSVGTSRNLPLWSPYQFIEYTPPEGWTLLGDGYLERGELTSLVGVGGLGKTRLALRLALAVILGKEWCGIATHGAPTRVVMLSTENGLRRWRTDLKKMLAPLTQEERDAVNAHLFIMALLPGEETDLNLGDPAAVSRLVGTLKQAKPGLVVLDPLADLIDGDENKTADLVATLRTLAHVQAKGAPDAAFLLVHHARTGAGNVAQAGDQFSAGNFGRGSKALYSRVRCEIQLAPGDREDPTILVLACGKSNNAPPFPARGLVFQDDTFDYVVDPTFDLETWRSDVNGKRTGKTCTIADVVGIVRELAPLPGAEVKAGPIKAEAKERLGVGERTAQTRLTEAVTAGYLKCQRKGVYRLGSKPLPR